MMNIVIMKEPLWVFNGAPGDGEDGRDGGFTMATSAVVPPDAVARRLFGGDEVIVIKTLIIKHDHYHYLCSS